MYDPEGIYEKGEVVDVDDMIDEYIYNEVDKQTAEWLRNLPYKEVAKFIADAWGLDIEFDSF